jgi:ATP-binding cassette subfamily B protein
MVQRADDILILDGGRVVERGPRADLAADPSSRFATLLRGGIEEMPHDHKERYAR